MALDLLDAPLRVTWDIAPVEGCLDDAALRTVTRRVVAGGVFFVTLEGRPLQHPALPEVVDLLCDGGCQVQVVTAGAPAEVARLASLQGRSPGVLLDGAAFLDPRCGPDLAALGDVVEALRTAGCEPALMLTPLRGNLRWIPVFLDACTTLGIGRFKLPNAGIGDSFRDYSPADLPRWQDLEAFRSAWTGTVAVDKAWPELEVHDLFLWEILTPGATESRSEYGGCQAANSLAHISIDGQVHPCAAWPEPLGSLRVSDFASIWQSTGRRAVRAQIERQPEGCNRCRDYALCHGGCRGLASKLNRAAGERDLMCRAPR